MIYYYIINTRKFVKIRAILSKLRYMKMFSFNFVHMKYDNDLSVHSRDIPETY